MAVSAVSHGDFDTRLRNIRGLDSNSLLRLHDQVNDVFIKSLSQPQRLRAGKAVERILKELQKRKVRP